MKTTNKGKGAPGANTPKNEESVEIKKVQGFDFEHLTGLIQSRNILKKHLDELNTQSQDPDFLEELKAGEAAEEKGQSSIKLIFSSNYNDHYEIKNAMLLSKLKTFLAETLTERLKEVEEEIELMTK